MRGFKTLYIYEGATGAWAFYSRSSTVNKGCGGQAARDFGEEALVAGFKCRCAALAAQRQPHGLARALARQQGGDFVRI
jgi:hypothetical protein